MITLFDRSAKKCTQMNCYRPTKPIEFGEDRSNRLNVMTFFIFCTLQNIAIYKINHEIECLLRKIVAKRYYNQNAT